MLNHCDEDSSINIFENTSKSINMIIYRQNHKNNPKIIHVQEFSSSLLNVLQFMNGNFAMESPTNKRAARERRNLLIKHIRRVVGVQQKLLYATMLATDDIISMTS